MYVSSTRSAVDMVLAPDRLSELVGAPVRAARMRIKPGVSVTVSLLRADTGRSAGWARLLWPGSRVKAAKAARRADRLGMRTTQRDTGDGLLFQSGEVAADPALVKHTAAARDADLLGALEGNLLRYNPLRRLVVRTPGGVVRVTAASQRRVNALQDFASRHVPVPPQLPVPDPPGTGHVSIQRFVGDTDLSRHHDQTATARAGAALAALHAATTALPEALRRNLESLVPDAENPALVHTRILNHLDPTLAARVHRLGEVMPRQPWEEPVFIHGDASPDQVLLDRSTGRIWLTDFDRARLAPAVVDLGSYLAMADSSTALALLEGYADAGGRVPGDDQLRQAVARARLERLQDPLRHGDPHWRRRIAAEIDRIEALLDASPGRAGWGFGKNLHCRQSQEAS
ncbi:MULTISPECIES: phosphotransferase family protein [Actinomyces]|uniref:Aminoglycoside phosphotransferase n=1 Tax=Actinomyces glycerinitolerans TaxID=1892869 RepID=A0A1M4RVX0_9ACTO|nr:MULTISPECIES: phosphotransferase [Actinomyces]RAX22926.1 aminoglycoside phosphotransferase family protein [Actinomyces sp. Z3]RAX24643.1 aminoglycoside phosphotransferase family protein [Actinomyces sp. Z5]SHE24050.1 aminoglycoside phosphotransferase [Actinomyces glycerinitolerans]